MLIEKKENYILINTDENLFSEFYNSFLKKEQGFEKENLILQTNILISVFDSDFGKDLLLK